MRVLTFEATETNEFQGARQKHESKMSSGNPARVWFKIIFWGGGRDYVGSA